MEMAGHSKDGQGLKRAEVPQKKKKVPPIILEILGYRQREKIENHCVR
jgi:hypothetical protein